MGPADNRTTIQARIDRILVRPGRRPIDEAHVANLMVSFREVGHRQPIEIKALRDDDPQRADYAYELTSGGHRLEAKRRLGAKIIDAMVQEDDELVSRIAEVDENLIRRDYTALERAQALATRLEAWAAMHPERADSTDGQVRAKRGRPVKSDTVSEFPVTMGFADEASAKVGFSTRTVERDLAVYRGLPAGLQADLQGTWLASNPGVLRQLAALGEPKEQAAVAKLLIEGKTKNVSDARALAAGNTPSKARQTEPDQAVKAFRAIWKAATPSAKAAILHELAGLKLPAGYGVSEPADA